MPFVDYASDLTIPGLGRGRFRTPPFFPTTAPAPGDSDPSQTGGPDLSQPYTGWGAPPQTLATNRRGSAGRPPNPMPRQRANPAQPTVFADPEADRVEAPSVGGPAVSTPPYPDWAGRSAETAARQAAQRRTQTVVGPSIGEGPVANGADGPLTGDPSAQTGEPDVSRPYPDWTKTLSDDTARQRQLLNNPPQPAGGVRGKIGSVVNALAAVTRWPGLSYAGGKLKYPGGDRYQADVARGQEELNVDRQQAEFQSIDDNRRSQRQESIRRMAQQDLDNQRTNYDRQMNNIDKAGGFEAAEIPPSVNTATIPADPTQPPSPINIPTTQRRFDPGLQPGQSRGLGTVQTLTDPDSGVSRNMVYPSRAVQQEMARVDAPQDIVDFYKDLPAGFKKMYPSVTAPTIAPDGKVAPEEAKRLEQKYQRDSTLLQSWNALTNKPAKEQPLMNVPPGDTVFDPNTRKQVFAAPPKPDSSQKPATRQQFDAIEKWKGDALIRAQTNAQNRLGKLNPKDADDQAEIATIYSNLRDQAQNIQNAYEDRIGRLTGNPVDHFEYPPMGAAAGPSPAAAQPRPPVPARNAAPAQPGGRQPSASPGTFSEAEVRQTAVRRGQDPDAAVAFMKSRGYRLTR